jgi:hypothetical protein
LKQLHLELKELGYEGSYDRVAAFARQWKAGQLEWVNSASKRTVIWSIFFTYGLPAAIFLFGVAYLTARIKQNRRSKRKSYNRRAWRKD